jgi:hypothetical protein
MIAFDMFYKFCVSPDEVYYVPHLVYTQLDDNGDTDANENKEVLDDIKNIGGELVACWKFETDCTGDLEDAGMNNGSYLEITTVRVYDNGDEKGDHVLVTSKIISDFHRGSTVEIWEKQVTPERIFEILEELEEKQRELYSR